MESHFTFFEKALIMCNEKFIDNPSTHSFLNNSLNQKTQFKKHLPHSNIKKNEDRFISINPEGCFVQSDETESPEKCKHEQINIEDNKHICIDCGQMLIENFISNQYCPNNIGMKKRRKSECNIYNDIPSYIQQHVTAKTIEIYQKVTLNKIFRNTFKRSIILACLHRASTLTGKDISYDDLLDIFTLKQHEANKGFSYVANNLPKNSEFSIPFDNEREETISVISILRNLRMSSLLKPVIAIFRLVKQRSNILNVSLCKSVICGCIYFWIKYKNIPKTLKEFAQDVKMSEMTIINKYLVISDVVMKSIMKELFCTLLKNCAISQLEGKNKYKYVLKQYKNSLYNPDKKILINNPFSINNITVTPCNSIRTTQTNIEQKDLKTPQNAPLNPSGTRARLSTPLNLYEPLPLDDVDDIKEWNILLDQKYYSHTSNVYTLNVSIFKNTRDLIIDFKKYNEINKIDANNLLKSILIDRFENGNIEIDTEYIDC